MMVENLRMGRNFEYNQIDSLCPSWKGKPQSESFKKRIFISLFFWGLKIKIKIVLGSNFAGS